MEKVRVYELAKEMNTTSKRLMEKLAEIDVHVKNHMSLLEEHELSALYKHIGVVKHDDSKKTDSDDKRHAAAASVPPRTNNTNANVKKDGKSAPRIIRTTEIIIDTKSEVNEAKSAELFKGTARQDTSSAPRNNQKTDYRVASNNSGLRPGYVRDTGPDLKNSGRPIERSDDRRKPIKDTAGEHNNIEPKQDPKPDNTKEVKPQNEQPQKTVQGNVEEKQNEMNLGNGERMETLIKNIDEAKKQQEVVKTEPNTEKPVSAAGMNTQKAEPVKSGEAAKPVEQSANRYHNNDAQPDARNDNNREPNHRPQGGNYGDNRRSFNDRPQGGNYGDNRRGPNDRPQGGNYGDNRRGPNDRPQGGNYGDNRPQGGNYGGNRPQGGNYGGNRPQGGNYGDNRPQGGNYGDNRPQGGNYGDNRPQGGNYGGNRPQGGNYGGNRPQGGNYGDNRRNFNDRPQGGNFGDNRRGPGDRPQGDRPQQGGFGNRQGDRRPQGQFRPGNKPLEIPKPELSAAQKEEMTSKISETRREFQNKDVDKDVKREQKKEVPKTQPGAGKEKRFKPQRVILGEKKGVQEVLSEDYILEEFYGDDGVKKTKRVAKLRKDAKGEHSENRHIPHRAVLTSITIPEDITVKDLAEALKKTSTDVIKKLMGLGIMATLNQVLDFDTASIISDEFGVKAEKTVVVSEEDILFDDSEDSEEGLEARPPVVVVMGHVDHGKTSLLDAIREANVTESEAGGITQHIGAYTVKTNNRNITFLDTPGHEAFTAMRARGAQVTDIAILVVAADDGIMPQTVEAINHAKAANVSIIVAINKIDKPGADPQRVKQDLTQYGLVVEEWGGDVIAVPVSAKKRMNIDQLLEMVLLTADILELKANPKKQAKGTVIEAKLDKNRGPIATVLVQRGTLHLGDSIVTGTTVGRIRAMNDDKGHKAKKAGPSTPVEILGLPDVPEAGEIFYAVTDEKVAKQLAEKRRLKQREEQLRATSRVSLDDLFTQIKEGKVKDLNIIVKADVQGSVEAVKQSLEKLSNDEVRVKTIHGAVGAINESDVTLAAVSNAIIIGFNVRPGPNVPEIAQNAGVDMRLYRVIYNAIEDIQAAMKGLLEPTFKEVALGKVEIRQIFKVSGVGTIAGCYVTDGKVSRNAEVRIVRDGIVVHEGKLASLKRFKDDAKDVAQGYECGLSIEKFNDIKEGDIIEAFVMEEVAR